MPSFIVPIYYSIITIEYYQKKGMNEYLHSTEEVKAVTKGFTRKQCAEAYNIERHYRDKLIPKIVDITHIRFLSRGVM